MLSSLGARVPPVQYVLYMGCTYAPVGRAKGQPCSLTPIAKSTQYVHGMDCPFVTRVARKDTPTRVGLFNLRVLTEINKIVVVVTGRFSVVDLRQLQFFDCGGGRGAAFELIGQGTAYAPAAAHRNPRPLTALRPHAHNHSRSYSPT